MDSQLLGFRWKRYWRDGHCYEGVPSNPPASRYESLCGRFTRAKSGGQGSGRPPAIMRCYECDVFEFEGVGAEASLDEDPKWRDYQ